MSYWASSIKEVTEILAKYDPPKLVDKNAGNFDEYKHEAELIFKRFSECKDEEELYILILYIFKKEVEYMGDLKEYKPIAKEIWELFS